MGESYWTLNEATDGMGRTFPQHQDMGAGYDYDAPDSVYNIGKNVSAEFVPNLKSIVIERGAVLTDLVSSAPIPHWAVIISESLYSVLKEHNLPGHQVFEAPVRHKDRDIAGYWVLHLPHLDCVTGEEPSPREVSRVIADHHETRCLDLFALYRPRRVAGWHVSPRLAEKVIELRLTGIRLGRSKLRQL